MGALDDVFDDVAEELIEEFGKKVTFVEKTISYDPEEDETTETTVEHERKISPPEGYKLSSINGTSIRRGDTHGILAAKGLDFTPARDMQVKFDDEVWSIVDVEKIFSGEKVAAYQLQLRK